VIEGLWEQFQTLLGLGSDIGKVSVSQMVLRTILIYAFTLVIIRLGSKRFLSEATAFDVIVSIMLGSIMSRAINGSAPFIPTLFAGLILVGLHWLLAILAYRTDWFGSLVKGNRVLLIKDGEIQHKGMRQASITSKDLDAALRLQTKQTDPAKVQLAYLERNGRISVIPFEREPQVVDIAVKDGVQTVRIKIE
jgi:uncharacterized membrane protein YcaP (DUF421 family)